MRFGRRRRARERRPVRALLDKQGDLERSSPWWRHAREHLVEHGLEQVTQPGEREPLLRLGGPRDEDTRRPAVCLGDSRLPERRLADPRLAFEDERARCAGRLVEERVDRREHSSSRPTISPTQATMDANPAGGKTWSEGAWGSRPRARRGGARPSPTSRGMTLIRPTLCPDVAADYRANTSTPREAGLPYVRRTLDAGSAMTENSGTRRLGVR